jgi:hypothetical protein
MFLLAACIDTSGLAGRGAEPGASVDTGKDSGTPGDDVGGVEDDETPGPRPAEVETYEALFDGAHVIEVDIMVDEAAAAELAIDPAGWARVALVVDGVALADAGAKMREGDTVQGRPAWKFKLDEFGEPRDLGWMERFSLDPMDEDPAQLRLPLESWLGHELGVPVPRAGFSRVSVNGEYRGLYAMVEGVDARFVGRRWAPGGGDTWEGQDEADFTESGVAAFEAVSGREDREALLAVAHRVRSAGDDFFRALDTLVDMDGFLAAWSFVLVAGDRGVYPFDLDRFFVYFDPSDGRARLIPRVDGQAWTDAGMGRWTDVLGTLAEQCYFYDAMCSSRLVEAARASAEAYAAADIGRVLDALSALTENDMNSDPTRDTTAGQVVAARVELRALAEGRPGQALAALEGAP